MSLALYALTAGAFGIGVSSGRASCCGCPSGASEHPYQRIESRGGDRPDMNQLQGKHDGL
jgi:hypothetical protein